MSFFPSALHEVIISIMLISTQQNLSSMLGKAEKSGSQTKDLDVSKARRRCCSLCVHETAPDGSVGFFNSKAGFADRSLSHLTPLLPSKGGKKQTVDSYITSLSARKKQPGRLETVLAVSCLEHLHYLFHFEWVLFSFPGNVCCICFWHTKQHIIACLD